MQDSRKPPARYGAGTLGVALAGAVLMATSAGAATLQGKPVAIGKGTAQLVVETDGSGAPTSIAISMTADALEGLPTEPNKESSEGSWEFMLPMPDGVKTGYSLAMIDWNPNGHPPEHVYTVPHFDFHFYTVDQAEVTAVKFTGPDDAAITVSDKGLIAPDYQVIPDTAINGMGVHALDVTAPELHGKPFTATFIYGYDKGKLTFLEPMVTRAFLETKPELSMPVKTPEHYSSPGAYPTAYSVRYDAGSNRYLIALDGLKHWQ